MNQTREIGLSSPSKVGVNRSNERRQSPRIRFPMLNYPVLDLDGSALRVLDLSETGVKFVGDANAQYKGNTKLDGTIEMLGIGQHLIKGRVVRMIGDLVAIEFDEPLPKYFIDYATTQSLSA